MRTIRWLVGEQLPHEPPGGVPQLLWDFKVTSISGGGTPLHEGDNAIVMEVNRGWYLTDIRVNCGCVAMVYQGPEWDNPPESIYQFAKSNKIRHLVRLPREEQWLQEHLSQPLFN